MRIPRIVTVDLPAGASADDVARRTCGTIVCVDGRMYGVWLTRVLSPTRVEVKLRRCHDALVRVVTADGQPGVRQRDPPLREPAVLDRLAEISAMP